MKLYVGQTRLGGSIRRYIERFNFVELRADPSRMPRRARLVEWSQQVPKDFAFALVVAPAAFDERGGESVAYATKVADVLKPSWWVLRSPPSITPAAGSVRRIRDVIEALPKGPRIAWEPSGPWDQGGVLRTAADLGLHVVRDGSREALPPGDIVYTRLRALGEGQNVSFGAADRLAEELEGRDEAFVVVEGAGASRVFGVLKAALLEGDEGHDGDDEDVEGDDGDDEGDEGGEEES